jgi:methylenetetrahydrofolate dehydrogenase (NADP+) / methenyltetrahydrofolate cyclohydrolase
MTAALIDGASIAREVRESLRERVATVQSARMTPGLAVIIVGEDPASRVYVRNKARACADIGMHSEIHELPADAAPEALLSRIEALNRNPAIHGILVQLPLPPGHDTAKVLEAIDVAKDVDGFHPYNQGLLVDDRCPLPPCTPAGVMVLLERSGTVVAGADAVVVGRSHIVGKPVALMLVNAGATVTVCHSRTRDLASHTARADILVVAVGRPNMIRADMVKPGATVIDVGINRLADGSLAGDVDFATVRDVARRITPVPGGVGPMTIAMLLANTVHAAERCVGRR